MRRHDITVTIGWTWEPEVNGEIPVAYDFRITAVVTPYVPASMYGGSDQTGWQEEGPTCEIREVSLEKIHDGAGTHSALTDPHRENIEEEFRAWLEAHPDVRVQIEFACYEKAGGSFSASPPDPGR